jgi:hypothetical protein
MTSSSPSLPDTSEPVTQPDLFRHPVRLSLAALALGLAVELLFYARPVGISLHIWAALVCVVAVGMAWAESRRPAKGSLWLILPIVGFAALAFVRLEPLTLFLNIVVVLALLAFWVRTFRTGRLSPSAGSTTRSRWHGFRSKHFCARGRCSRPPTVRRLAIVAPTAGWWQSCAGWCWRCRSWWSSPHC